VLTLSVAWKRTILCAFFLCTFVLAGCSRQKLFDFFSSKKHTTSKEHVHPQGALPVWHGACPCLAIVLDDLGSDLAAADEIFALNYPLTISVLPHHPHSTEIAEEAHSRGYQVMLHLPMRSVANETPEAEEIHTGMSSAKISGELDGMLRSVPHVVGVNNHQGSQATSDAALMKELMPLLRAHQLFFLDSRTTAATVAFDAARQAGVRSAFRDVPFLDDVQDTTEIRKQLQLAIRGAKEKGQAIAIGHPHPTTLHALTEVLPQVEAQGVQLVFVSTLVHL
jgi:polysaccharide deacetylase 2 family uncharacterized protein YibQ